MNNLKTQLTNRALWYDGTVEVNPDKIPELILSGVPISKICATRENADITKFNVLEEIPIQIGKESNGEFDLAWNIPDEYLQLDIDLKIKQLCEGYPAVYLDRAKLELSEIKRRKLENLFRTIFYIVGTFKNQGSVWGVGRGSSCASLVLFLIGLHKVDPIKYKIDYSEFFHD